MKLLRRYLRGKTGQKLTSRAYVRTLWWLKWLKNAINSSCPGTLKAIKIKKHQMKLLRRYFRGKTGQKLTSRAYAQTLWWLKCLKNAIYSSCPGTLKAIKIKKHHVKLLCRYLRGKTGFSGRTLAHEPKICLFFCI